jgi:heptosyltransferase-3
MPTEFRTEARTDLPDDLFAYLPDAIDPALLKRALIIKLRHHGDVLLASPVLSALKEAAPQCEIDALVFADTAAMLAGHPALAQVHTLDRNAKKLGMSKQVTGEWDAFWKLRARHYDIVIHLTDHPRGAWLARFLGARWSVAPQRAKPAKWWKKSFTHLYRTVGGGRRHTVDTHLDALRRIGMRPSLEARKLCLVPGADAQARVDARLAELDVAAGRFIHFHPASRWFFKCWPVEQCAALLGALAARGEQIVLTAAPDEREKQMVDAILALLEPALRARAINLAGQFSLKELAALTSRARIFIGVDSAPMHIAAAVGTPCVALFGPSGDKEWGPWMVPSEIVTSNHSCRPCGFDGCGGGKVSECLTTIPANRVLAAVDRVLGSVV